MFERFSLDELFQKLEESCDRTPLELVQAILQKEQAAVCRLRAVLRDEFYWNTTGDALWMPLHVVKLLGVLKAEEAIPELIDALTRATIADDEWIMEDLPTVFGKMGSAAIDPLMDYIRQPPDLNEEDRWWPRSTAVAGLVAIALRHPEEKPRILAFLHGLFREGEDPEFLGFVASHLLDLRDSASLQVLEWAFDRNMIEPTVIDLDFVREKWQMPPSLEEYNQDLLAFYRPDVVRARQVRWEEERKREEQRIKERQRRRQEELPRELKRLEVILNSPPSIPSQKVGRNEPCPCGSGKKFKKCCLPRLQVIPPKQILGVGYYTTPLYLQDASAHDPLLVLENLTALAEEAEEDGDVALAMNILQRIEPLADRVGMLGNLLQDRADVCLTHPELGDAGLAEIRRLEAFFRDRDPVQAMHVRMDAADYLGMLERREEGRREYENLLKEATPDFYFARIRFARFLKKGGQVMGAVAQYRYVLEQAEAANEEDLEMAAGELKDLAVRHHIPLDAHTEEAIQKYLYSLLSGDDSVEEK